MQSHLQSCVLSHRHHVGDVVDCDGAWLQAHPRGGAMVITVSGEIDAGNIHTLAAPLAQFASLRSPLVLNLQPLDFIAVTGWTALIALSSQYREAGVAWALVAGTAFKRLLSFMNEQSSLPFANSVEEAIWEVAALRVPRRRLRVVAPRLTRC